MVSPYQLLTRDQFRNGTFDRDNQTCLIPWCNHTHADMHMDAHHIIERAEWTDGGYYLANGATVCEDHHKHAEISAIPPQAFWRWIGVDPWYPAEFPEGDFNKWGIKDKRGEQFKTPNELREEAGRPIKYPSSPYLPFSPEGETSIDWKGFDHMKGIPFVVTIKMDGSNACLTRDSVVARNGNHADHKSFDELKAIHQGIKHLIPDDIQIFGEWLYAKHSIHYTEGIALEAKFQVFAVYDKKYRIFADWEEVKKWAHALGFPTVPVVLEDTYNEDWEFWGLHKLFEHVVGQGHEGIVIRSKYPFHYGQFQTYLAKAVRAGHVQTDKHWSNGPIVKNVVQ